MIENIFLLLINTSVNVYVPVVMLTSICNYFQLVCDENSTAFLAVIYQWAKLHISLQRTCPTGANLDIRPVQNLNRPIE